MLSTSSPRKRWFTPKPAAFTPRDDRQASPPIPRIENSLRARDAGDYFRLDLTADFIFPQNRCPFGAQAPAEKTAPRRAALRGCTRSAVMLSISGSAFVPPPA